MSRCCGAKCFATHANRGVTHAVPNISLSSAKSDARLHLALALALFLMAHRGGPRIQAGVRAHRA
nr:MAG TPA: hypothetical protein [Caudoviricetes sp.]